jgi:predicted component of type VI protein secretion system
MQTVYVYEKADIEALIQAGLEPIYTWSEQITNSINELSVSVTTLQDINQAQNKRINALKSRVTALEDASGIYSDVY